MIYRYIRYSTDRQDESEQMNIIDSWAKNHGVVIDQTVSDKGVSGTTDYKRRNLGGLVAAMEAGDTLIVSELSRLTRGGIASLSELIAKHFAPGKMRLVICNVGLDIDCANLNAMTELQLSMLAAFAKMERESIVSRTRAALEMRKKMIRENGGFVSKAGYWRTHLGSQTPRDMAALYERSLDIRREARDNDEDYQRAKSVARSLSEQGKSLRTIADYLNDDMHFHCRRGGAWCANSVRRLLQ